MRKKFFGVFVLFLTQLCVVGCSRDKSSLHPKIVSGQLANGLRYTVLPNEKPKGRISMRLVVRVGSHVETENQAGIAHFTEHMCFNGSKRFPPGTLIKYFQQIGMDFGGDTNAFTSVDATVYKLELPGIEKEDIARGLEVFRDFADGVLFEPDEIERERGVVLSELRIGNTPEYRSFVREIQECLPNHSLSRSCQVIGEESTIKSFTQKDFLEFYRQWYRPGHMHVVVVGPIVSTDDLVHQIEAVFASIPARAEVARPPFGEPNTQPPKVFHLHKDAELSTAAIEFLTFKPLVRSRNHEVSRVDDLYAGILQNLVSHRYESLMKKPNSPIAFVGCNCGQFGLSNLNVFSTIAGCAEERWKETLALVEKENRRILKFGFTKEEVDWVKRSMEGTLELDALVEKHEDFESEDLIDDIVNFIVHDWSYTSEKYDLEFFRKNERKITPKNCLQFLKKQIGKQQHIWLEGPFGDSVTLDDLVQTHSDSSRKRVSPPPRSKDKHFAYTSFGEPGRIANVFSIPDLDVQHIRFANNVHLTLKNNERSSGHVGVSVRVGSGFLEIASPDKPCLDRLASTAFVQGGLVEHDTLELERLFAGKNINVDCSVEDDAFVFLANTDQCSIRDQLNLLCAYIVYPGYRPEAVDQFRRSLDALYNYFDHNPLGPLARYGTRYLNGGDERFGYPDKKVAVERNFQELKSILTPILENGYVEICIVANFSHSNDGENFRAKVINDVAETFGALPTRAEKKDRLEEARHVPWPHGGETKVLTYSSDSLKALVHVVWPTEDIWNISNSRRLNILGILLGNRILFEIRQSLGATYTPKVSSPQSDTFVHRGAIEATLVVDPEQVIVVRDKIVGIAQSLAANPVSTEEFERAVNPLLSSLKKQIQIDSYWLGLLCNSGEYPVKLDWAATVEDEYKNMLPEDILPLAQRYLTPDKAITIIVIPEGSEEMAKKQEISRDGN